jgi:hypothetical protein
MQVIIFLLIIIGIYVNYNNPCKMHKKKNFKYLLELIYLVEEHMEVVNLIQIKHLK